MSFTVRCCCSCAGVVPRTAEKPPFASITGSGSGAWQLHEQGSARKCAGVQGRKSKQDGGYAFWHQQESDVVTLSTAGYRE